MPSGEGTATKIGPVDLSVAGIETYARLLGVARDPVKLAFGVGLLLYGRDFAHVILFAQAFKVTGLALVAGGAATIAADYKAFVSRVDKRAVSPLHAIKASLDPRAVRAILSGAYAGAVACIAAVVSPVAGATGVGLSIGATLEPHVQPFITGQLAKRGLARGKWADFGVSSAPHLLSVLGALLAKNYINTLSGSLIGSQMLTQVTTKYIHMLLRGLAGKFPHSAMLQKAAKGFSPRHPAVGFVSVGVAVAAFTGQQRQATKLTFPMKLVLGVPVLVEKAMRALKWALLGRASGQS
mmetsp:Transcript_33744/g.79047  ORF Transcript_33744/g.79047 Transcript_33744/m.79047 type:complete len:296 (+) Transcript_33744:1-888(+)